MHPALKIRTPNEQYDPRLVDLFAFACPLTLFVCFLTSIARNIGGTRASQMGNMYLLTAPKLANCCYICTVIHTLLSVSSGPAGQCLLLLLQGPDRQRQGAGVGKRAGGGWSACVKGRDAVKDRIVIHILYARNPGIFGIIQFTFCLPIIEAKCLPWEIRRFERKVPPSLTPLFC